MNFDENMVRKTIELLHEDEVYEVRCVNGKYISSGYYCGADKLIENLRFMPDEGNYYLTIQGIDDACYSRIQRDKFAQGKNTTSDSDCKVYKHLLIDLDPVRPAGVSSTDEELNAAHDVAKKVYSYLKKFGFEDPLAAMSGNGWHLIYKIALKNTKENAGIIEKSLKYLSMMFSTDEVNVDTSVFNPSRISKLYGTVSRKGADTAERPHRMTYISSPKDGTPLKVTRAAFLSELADKCPVKEKTRISYKGDSVRRIDDLGDWLSAHNVPVREKIIGGGTTRFILECCPFNSEHKNKDAAVFQTVDGAFGFHCFHDSCSDKHWHDFRLVYEPDFVTFGEPDRSIKPNHMSVNKLPENIEKTFSDKAEDQAPPKKAPCFYTLSDIIAFPEQPEEYIGTGINEFDRTIGGLKKGLVTCVSGLRGSGKSSLLSQVVLHAALLQGARTAMFSGELTARSASDWLFRQAAGELAERESKFSTKYYVPGNIKKKIAENIGDKIFIYNNDWGNNYATVINCMIKAVKEDKVDLILLDNLMSLDIICLDPKDKYKSQSLFVEHLENFAKRANIHIIFVAHPRKAQGFLRLDDISGSGDIVNRVDNAIIIHRRNNDFRTKTKDMFKWKDYHPLYASGVGNVIEICKNRENGTQDKFIPLYFEPGTKRLKNTDDEKINFFPNGLGIEPF